MWEGRQACSTSTRVTRMYNYVERCIVHQQLLIRKASHTRNSPDRTYMILHQKSPQISRLRKSKQWMNHHVQIHSLKVDLNTYATPEQCIQIRYITIPTNPFQDSSRFTQKAAVQLPTVQCSSRKEHICRCVQTLRKGRRIQFCRNQNNNFLFFPSHQSHRPWRSSPPTRHSCRMIRILARSMRS